MSSVTKIIIPILIALVAPVVPALMIAGAQSSFGAVNDLPEYYAAARMLAEGDGGNIYALERLGAVQQALFPDMQGRVVGLYVPPLAVIWLLPLSLIPAQLAPVVWTAMLVVAGAASLLVIKKLFGLSWASLLWLWSVVAVCGPLYESIRIGQLVPLLLLGFCLSLLAVKKRQAPLAAFALTVMLLKPQELAPFVVFLLGARRHSTLAWLACFALVFALVSFALVGTEGYSNYFSLLSGSVEMTAGMQPELNPTVRGQLLRLLPGSKLAVTMASVFVMVAALVFIFWLGRRLGAGDRWLERGLAAALPLGLLTTLHLHDYDLLLLVPALVAFLSGSSARRLPSWAAFVGMAALAPFLLPLYKWIHYDYLLLGGGLLNPLFVILAAYSLVVPWLVLWQPEDAPKSAA